MSESTPTPVVDLLTRILGVDLSTPRDLGLQPVPEGYITLGTLSENAQKVLCFGIDILKEISKIKQEFTEAIQVYNKLHEADDGLPEDACKQQEQAMNQLRAQLEELNMLKHATKAILYIMLELEYPQHKEGIPDSTTINEGFVVSMLPMPSPTEMFADIRACLSELELLMAQDRGEELQEDTEPAAEDSTAEASTENSEVVPEETVVQPTDEELVSPEK